VSSYFRNSNLCVVGTMSSPASSLSSPCRRWPGGRPFGGSHGASSRVGGELGLRQIDALDGRRQCVLLGVQFVGGLLQRRHLCLHRVDVVQLALHGP
jgi:hypothetical protein